MVNKEEKFNLKKITGKETFCRRRVICGIVLIVAAIIIGIIMIPSLSTKTNAYTIYMLTRDVPESTLITPENFETYFTSYATSDVNIASVAVNEQKSAYGSYTKYRLNKNNYLKKSDLTEFKVVSNNTVPDGKELVGLNISSISEDIGFMPKAGDIIRFYGVESTPDNTVRVSKYGRLETNATDLEATPYDLLQYVEVYSVLDGNGDSVEKTGANPTNMVVILEQAQVEQLIEVEKGTGKYLSLISSGDPVTAKRLLKEQSKITAEHNLLEQLAEDIGKETVSFSLSLFELPDDKPRIGDVVRIYYVEKTEYQEIGSDKKINTVEKLEIKRPDLLSLLEVVDIYDKNGASIQLSSGGDDQPRYPANAGAYYIGLSVSEDQFLEISELLKEHELYIEIVPEIDVNDETIEKQNTAIRLARIEKHIADQEAAEQAELEEEARIAEEERIAKEKAEAAKKESENAEKQSNGKKSK